MCEQDGPDILWLIKNDPEVQKVIMELVDRHRHYSGVSADNQGMSVQVLGVEWESEEGD